jgi:hypothetical protein
MKAHPRVYPGWVVLLRRALKGRQNRIGPETGGKLLLATSERLESLTKGNLPLNLSTFTGQLIEPDRSPWRGVPQVKHSDQQGNYCCR